MIDPNLYLLTHPEKWPHGNQLPVTRRGSDPIHNRKDAGIVMNYNLCRVWTEVFLGENPEEGIPVDYMTSEGLLEDWSID